MNSKTTKRALLGSTVALLLCFTMLLGITFAWFTDSAVSGSNVITAGNLDIVVEYTLDGENWADLDGAEDLFEKGLWEPGHTEVVALRIKNNGTLALKYVANMNVVSETKGKTKDNADIVLSDILTVSTLAQQDNEFGAIALSLAFMGENSVAYETTTTFKATNVLGSEKELLPGAAHYLIIKVDMAETVGNEANHNGTDAPSINFGINVLATQFTYENDSFGNDYDVNATYPTVVSTIEELNGALTNEADTVYVSAGTYTFPASNLSQGDVLVCDEGTVFEGTSSLSINGATVVGAIFDAGNDNISASGTINGTFKDCVFTGGSEGVRWCYSNVGETAVFENCVFEATLRGVHFDGLDGEVYFKNCVINGFNALGGSGSATFEDCAFGCDASNYNGLNIYLDVNLINCSFEYISGKVNFIDMEGEGKTLAITNCTATLDGVVVSVSDFVGGSKLAQNTVIYN